MRIRCKFRCHEVDAVKNTDGSTMHENVSLAAVTDDGPGDNAEWSKWTPSGDLSMSITNPRAFGAFEKGKNYFLDVTPVE